MGKVMDSRKLGLAVGMRMPLVEKTNSELNSSVKGYDKKSSTRKGLESIGRLLTDTPVTLNTPHNSPNIDFGGSGCFKVKPVSNYSNYRETPPRDIYLTPSESLDVGGELLKESNKPRKIISTTQVKRLQLRMKLAHYKHTTNQTHLKFSDILRRHTQRTLNKKPSKSHRKLRKLVGSVPYTAHLPKETDQMSINSSSSSNRHYITPKKTSPARTQTTTGITTTNATPIAVRAANSLLQLFSTSSR